MAPLTKVDHPGGSYVTDGSGTRGVQSMGALSIHVDVRVPQCRVRGELEPIYLICRLPKRGRFGFLACLLAPASLSPRASLTTRREAAPLVSEWWRSRTSNPTSMRVFFHAYA
ncbi:hypothetical protein CBM2609_U10059 [Cupriavidus taiwanensis]|nr:hypothetical protein CBM2604_U10033 [Cupriavidus taiwanensis]SOZ34463.1 hypothetical protein CBM2609_U10059 [Cupriavidus taiwanensis]SOZ53016.1 hypothetical protein CBM2610_U10032 [Cupriavidus taiwanensis]